MRGLLLLAALAVLLGGCRGCKNDHPYVPAGPDGAAATADDAGEARPSGPAAPGPGPGGGAEAAVALAPGVTSWRGDGLVIDGGGQEIALLLARDFDGDGKTDALAILRPPLAERKPGASTGRLVYVRGGEPNVPPAAIAVGPALGQWPACVATARLEKVGPRSVFAEIGSDCPKAIGTRAISVVRLAPPAPAVAFDAILTDPRDAPSLGLAVESADRDGDGVDDTVLRFTVDGVDARLAFFDRPAGPSRDPEEPEASLKTAAARIAKAKPDEVPAMVDRLRAAYRALCDEGGAPRITHVHGGPAPTCGTSKVLEDAGIAAVRAYAQSGDVFGAFAAAEIAQAAPATKTAARSSELEKHLATAAPVESAKAVRVLATLVDSPSDAEPQWGPLTFDATNQLLVRAGKTVTSVDPENGDEHADGAAAWPAEVVSPDATRRWSAAFQVCDDGAARASFTVAETNTTITAPLPLVPRLGRACSGHGEPLLVQPIAWGPRGLEAIVAGRPFIFKSEGANEMTASPLAPFLDERPPPGSPRMGAKMAVAVPNALLVLAEGKWRNLRSPDVKPSELRACTIDDTATRVACVRRGKVVLLQR
ncbi:MAG: hypothetical protein KIT84_27005 [Labilithrix sp.]|nr:hypothetical protein [Labilithrix sp.]MCW5814705.1 hypothetical protein [Labilithrix sp.]